MAKSKTDYYVIMSEKGCDEYPSKRDAFHVSDVLTYNAVTHQVLRYNDGTVTVERHYISGRKA